MLRLNEAQRELASDKLGDVANLAFAGLTLGQLLAGTVSWFWAIAGVTGWCVLIAIALSLRRTR